MAIVMGFYSYLEEQGSIKPTVKPVAKSPISATPKKPITPKKQEGSKEWWDRLSAEKQQEWLRNNPEGSAKQNVDTGSWILKSKDQPGVVQKGKPKQGEIEVKPTTPEDLLPLDKQEELTKKAYDHVYNGKEIDLPDENGISKDRQGELTKQAYDHIHTGKKIKSRSDISDYPKDAKDITDEMKDRQADYSDISKQMNENIKSIREGNAEIETLSGKIDRTNVSTIRENAERELNTYSNYLAADTALRVRDFIDIYKRNLKKGIDDGTLKDVDAEMLNKLSIDCIHKIMHQEVESNRQQFTDHGIRHIVGDIKRAESIAKIMNPNITGRESLLLNFVAINHDIGYTTPLIREGGLRGVMVSGDHPKFSKKITGQQEDLWNQGKIFSKEEYDKALDIIGSHDNTKLDKKDVLGTSMRLADNLSLFNNEKLPSAFKYVKGGDRILIDMGIAAKKEDTKSFEKLKKDLHNKIDSSTLNENLKRDLKSATNEITHLTPKFTLGVLAGNISNIKNVDGKIEINIKYDKYDKVLQKIFDMGQKQTKKLLEDYGIKDYNKTSYDLGDFIRLNIKGIESKTSNEGIDFYSFLKEQCG